MRTLLERDWIRVVGQREVPGRPSMYGTTKAFLDYFNLNKLEQLPPLVEIKAMLEPTLVADEKTAQTVNSTKAETVDDSSSGDAASDENVVNDAAAEDMTADTVTEAAIDGTDSETHS